MTDRRTAATGGCQCGAVRYEILAPPRKLYVCHCRECQKQTASAYGISAIVRREDFRATQGEPKSWVRVADSGRRLRLMFCPDCGSRVWHDREGIDWPTISIEGGSLDQPLDLRAAVHVWTSRKLPGVVIPEDAAQFPLGD
jgi:hypothetical protein